MTILFRGIRTKAAAAVGAVALAGMGVTLGATPAHAAKSDCPSGALCVWTQTSYGGTRGQVFGNNADLTIYYAFNNAKSLYNHGNSCDVTIYTGKNYSGYSMTIDRGDAFSLSENSVFYNNISSNKWTNCS
ncbi:peptidase inhibitor family I36 protein [Streptomyces sp. NPDC002643]